MKYIATVILFSEAGAAARCSWSHRAEIIREPVPETSIHCGLLAPGGPGAGSLAVRVPAEAVRVVPGLEAGPQLHQVRRWGSRDGWGGQQRRAQPLPGIRVALSGLQ